MTNNLSRLIISIEGLSQKDYLKHTNRKINYENFCEKLKNLYKRKKSCTIHLKIHNNAVPTKKDQEKFLETFQSICDEIYIENLVDLWPETDASYVTSGNHRFISKKPDRVKVCSQIFKTMQINSDGSVIPCSIDWEAKNKIGYLKNSSLVEIWNGYKMQQLRQRHLKGERFDFSPCSTCSFNETSDKDRIDDFAEDILSRI